MLTLDWKSDGKNSQYSFAYKKMRHIFHSGRSWDFSQLLTLDYWKEQLKFNKSTCKLSLVLV